MFPRIKICQSFVIEFNPLSLKESQCKSRIIIKQKQEMKKEWLDQKLKAMLLQIIEKLANTHKTT